MAQYVCVVSDLLQMIIKGGYMGNNIYIGARYVPKFDGDYDSEKVYEPLTIVIYNGSSYTSKMSVPAGILPTDSAYWANTGNLNGMISALQDEINEINDVITSLLNNEKDPESLFFNIPSYPWEIAVHQYPDNIANKVQSGCILPDGKFAMYRASSDDSTGYLMLFNADGTFNNEISANIGHGNDMCWSTKLNKLLITGESIVYTFTRAGDTFARSTDIIIPSGYTVHGITMIGSDYYVYDMDANTLFKTDDLVTFETINSDLTPYGGVNYYRQGIYTDGDFIYWLAFVRDPENFAFVNAYDIEGNYKDSFAYPNGWGEIEWIDFKDGFMYSCTRDNDILSNGVILLRKDHYRRIDKSTYPQPVQTGGGHINTYVYIDDTYNGAFSGGRSADKPFINGRMAQKCTAGISNFAIRNAPNNTHIVLQDYNGRIRDTDSANLLSAEFIRCNVELWGAVKLNCPSVTLTNTTFKGNITGDVAMNRSVFAGHLVGSAAGDYNVATCAVSGTGNVTPA